MNLVLIFIYLTVSQELVTSIVYSLYSYLSIYSRRLYWSYMYTGWISCISIYLWTLLYLSLVFTYIYISLSIYLTFNQSICLFTWILSTGYSPCTAGSPKPGPCLTWPWPSQNYLTSIQSLYLFTWILSIGYSPCTAGSPEPEPCLTWRRSSHNYLSKCLSSIQSICLCTWILSIGYM